MITEKDLQEAIAECQGVKNPNANTCIMLASYLTIKQHLYPSKEPEEFRYSYAAPQVEPMIDYYSDTEFGKAVEGKETYYIMELMDELMSALQVMNPALYGSVMRKLA